MTSDGLSDGGERCPKTAEGVLGSTVSAVLIRRLPFSGLGKRFDFCVGIAA